jgi:flagellar hook-associated protein 2
MFGSLSTSNSGGQEGRYAMEITASNDGSDHLVLTYDRHGSDFSFTVEEDTDTGLWTGSQTTPVEVNNGQDVAGTINGEAATGKGQILTGDAGSTGVEGLMLKYTGTDTGPAGSVILTLGVAERFDRALYNITDSVDGYLSFKLDSLKNSIEDYATRIEESEARLELKIESMINRFVAMEIAIAEIQSQSQWLISQINTLYA